MTGASAGGTGPGAAIRAEGRGLPVAPVVPELIAALRDHGTAVLAAPPGTGKTTLVPLLLADAPPASGGGKVLVAEPRRMAARAAARRMAWLLGEPVGERVGFTVRGERRVSARTAVEVVTTGVLLQRLQRDPELAGVGTVMLDECHERHLDADTSMAFLLDVRNVLRPGLRLVAASATTETAAWAALLDGPVVEAAGVLHPVDVRWAPPAPPVRPPHGTRVDPALLDHVAAVVRRALRDHEGDVLCFLPGAGEISRVAGLLAGPLSGLGVDVLQVHGRAPAAVQDAALAPGERRRVLLATSVAESSLTVPGVRVVVDCGLAREPRMDHARGLGALATVRVSRAAARQRAGRAGREAPGTVYRCWSEAEHVRLPRQPAPEIALADLTSFALQTACWGDPDATGLGLLDPPPPGALAAARAALRDLGAVDAAGRATDRGRRLALVGLHPRLARALVDAAPTVGATRAAEITALLSEELPASYGTDLTAAWHTARRTKDAYTARWRAEARRLESALSAAAGPPQDRGGGRDRTGDAARTDSPGATADGLDRDRDRTDDGVRRSAAGHGSGGSGGGATHTTASSGATDSPDRSRDRTDGTARQSAVADDTSGAGGAPRTDSPGAADGRDRTGDAAPASGAADSGRQQRRGRHDIPRRGAGEDGRERGARSGGGAGGLTDDAAAGLVVALAFPERVARRRGAGTYLMVSGTGAEAPAGVSGAEWIAVAVADRGVGRSDARVRVAAVIDEETARAAAGGVPASYEEVRWRDGDVVARTVERLGAVELNAAALRRPDPGLLRAALLEGLRAEGTGLLRWTRDARDLRDRMAFVRRVRGEPWPDVAEEALLERSGEWLGPELARAGRRADLERIDAGAALHRLLPWATGQAARFGELAPERIEVPSGSRIRVDYSGEQPVLAVKLQELFGLRETPRVGVSPGGPAGQGVPVLVHLLSPAGRPAAVTADLASFWREGYRAVRAELRGRYPRHPWPQDPSTAEPTKHVNRRR